MSTREPISEAHRELGALLCKARKDAGLTTRGMGFTSGHISNVENGYTMPGRDLVSTYEKLGGNRLALLKAYESAKKATEDKKRRRVIPELVKDEAIAPDSDPGLIRSQYCVEEAEIYYHLDSAGIITHCDSIALLRALKPTRLYIKGIRYNSEYRRGVVTIHEGSGGRIVQQAEHDSGLVRTIFDLGNELKPTDPEPHRISLRATVSSKVPAEPLLWYENSTGPTVRFAMRVQFQDPAMPKQVWWFRSMSILETQTNPSADKILEPNKSGFYSYEFFDLAKSEYCGLAWSRAE